MLDVVVSMNLLLPEVLFKKIKGPQTPLFKLIFTSFEEGFRYIFTKSLIQGFSQSLLVDSQDLTD